MKAPIVAFFNSKGGVGKTSLVYNLAWTFADLGVKVIAVDLDHQANLTVLALGDGEAEALWAEERRPSTIYRSVQPLLEGDGEVETPEVISIGDGIGLVPGDLALSGVEDELSRAWSECASGSLRALRVTTALGRAIEEAVERFGAGLVLADMAPTLGAVNRAALIAADHVVIPVSLDALLIHNMKILGKTIERWRREWKTWRDLLQDSNRRALPSGSMNPLGYAVARPRVFRGQVVRRDALWMETLPMLFRETMLSASSGPDLRVDDDPYFLGLVKNYYSLMALAHEAHKPVHHLRPADGAMGAHQAAAMAAWSDFTHIAYKIADRVGLELEEPPEQSAASSRSSGLG